MDASPGEFWDERFAGADYAYGVEPTAFIRDAASLLKPGAKVLVPGDGEGRHGVFLATLGCEVTTVDASPLGITKAQSLAKANGVQIETQQADLRQWSWPEEAYDAVVSVFLHFEPTDRVRIHTAMKRALRPQGFLLIQGFTVAQLKKQAEGHSGGPRQEDMLFTRNMLLEDFSSLRLKTIEEVEMSFGGDGLHQGQGSTIQAIFQQSE